MTRRRLDAELVRRGLVSSRAEAQEAIRAGLVTVGGVPAAKPASLVDAADAVALSGPARPFVSRAGWKLAAALERFEVDPSGTYCLDAGASTGGFTDCLLQAGAAKVVAVDVGYGQLAWELRTDPRVVVIERTNVRDLTPDTIPFRPQLVVADLSFISLALVVPPLARLAAEGATFVLLVKPQFEAGRRQVGRGGVVRDPEVWEAAVMRVVDVAAGEGLRTLGVMASPLPGPAGNVEFLLHLSSKGEDPVDVRQTVEAAVSQGRELLT